MRSSRHVTRVSTLMIQRVSAGHGSMDTDVSEGRGETDPAWAIDRTRGSSVRALRQGVPSDVRRLPGDRRSVVLGGRKEGNPIWEPGRLQWMARQPSGYITLFSPPLLAPDISFSDYPPRKISLFVSPGYLCTCFIQWPLSTWMPLSSINPRPGRTGVVTGGLQHRTVVLSRLTKSATILRLLDRATSRAGDSKITT